MPRNSQKPLIEVTNLTIERDRPILRDLSWRVEKGEHWAILGPNGSGKTALLRSLAGYFTPTSGEIALFGNSADDPWDELRRHIGFVSSSVAQQIEHDEPVIETILSGGEAMINYWVRRTPRSARERAKRVLKDIECTHLANSPWHHLSQGEKQRILLGRALMAKSTRFLVLDEPCAGLDPVARESFLAFLERFAKRSSRTPSLLFVTHHVEEIIPSISHALLLADGRVVASGPKEKALTSKTLSSAFDSPLRLSSRNGRYALTISPTTKGFPSR